MIALGTSRIRVGTGIAYAFARSPITTAALAADISVASGGRFALGLGTGTRGIRRRMLGETFERAVSRFREYVDVVRAAWTATDGLHYSGQFYSVDDPGFRTGHDPKALEGMEICGAATNRLMIRAAASACDGVLLHPVTRYAPYLESAALPDVRAGADRRHRGSAPWVALWCLTAVDDDEEKARERAAHALAFYFTTPSYSNIVKGERWEPTVHEIVAFFREHGAAADPRRLAALVPDEMIDDFTLAGTPRDVQQRLTRLEDDLAARGVDEVVLQPAVGASPGDSIAERYRAVISAGSAARTEAVP
jgi:alkanesulfonate monooxygenase SsuD/methylene tetrahydromethanopterin reductase-like flavin-dependent oxidoreductase (luciferase family)